MDSYQSLRPGEQFSIFKDCYSELRSRTRAFWVKASSYSELRRFINFLRIGEVGEARYPNRFAMSDDSLATASGKTVVDTRLDDIRTGWGTQGTYNWTD